jgi:hypothetical protein
MILGLTICISPVTGAAIARQTGAVQQPGCAGGSTSSPLADRGAGDRADAGERERLLLERIDRLERRLAELESKVDASSRPALAEHLDAGNPAATARPAGLLNQPRYSAATDIRQVAPASADAAQATSAPPRPAESGPGLLSKDDRSLLDFIRGTTFNLTIDGYYGYNFNKPIGAVNLLRANDVLSNSFSLNQATMVIERAPDVAAGRRFGLRLDLQYGQATESFQGSAVNENRPQVYRPIWQAYGTYVAPIGSGLTIDFGKWACPMGIENNYNKDQMNYSRSYFFNFLPFYHFGFRSSYNINGKLNVTYWLVNGINQSEDFNGFKSQAILFTVKPARSLSWTTVYYTGIEGEAVVPLYNPTRPALPTQPGLPTQSVTPAPRGREHIFDSYATWSATPKLTVAAEGDYVINRLQTFSTPAHVIGGALYTRYQFTGKIALAGRAEYLSDRGGLFSGVTQALKETTLTAEYKFAEGFLVRGEWRRDFSNQPFFLTQASGVLSQQQNTATLGLVWWFGRKVGSW